MNIEDAIRDIEEELRECAEDPYRPFHATTEDVRALLAGYEAAVRDLRHIDKCDICVHTDKVPEGCDFMCSKCAHTCKCGDCRNESLWEWRGPKPDKEEHK